MDAYVSFVFEWMFLISNLVTMAVLRVCDRFLSWNILTGISVWFELALFQLEFIAATTVPDEESFLLQLPCKLPSDAGIVSDDEFYSISLQNLFF